MVFFEGNWHVGYFSASWLHTDDIKLNHMIINALMFKASNELSIGKSLNGAVTL